MTQRDLSLEREIGLLVHVLITVRIPSKLIQGMTGGAWFFYVGSSACSHIKALGFSPFPRQRELHVPICTVLEVYFIRPVFLVCTGENSMVVLV